MTSFSPVHYHRQPDHGSDADPCTRIVKQGHAREMAIEMLEQVGIASPHRLVDAYPHQFCGGMRQRAMIAMALVCGPSLLIADEPTTALDVTIEAQILELIKDLQEEFGMALMYISHDLAVVGQMADEIMVMYLGMVMEHASTDEIFDDPLHPYTLALWRSIPKIEGKLEAASDQRHPAQPLSPMSRAAPSSRAASGG